MMVKRYAPSKDFRKQARLKDTHTHKDKNVDNLSVLTIVFFFFFFKRRQIGGEKLIFFSHVNKTEVFCVYTIAPKKKM